MIAEIYPITRLPRRFGFFDYTVPEGLDVHIGDVVRAPLRGRRILGVVRRTKGTSTFKKLSSLDEIMASQLFDRGDVLRIETIARAIFQSPSSVFDAALHGWKPMQGKLEQRVGTMTRQSLSKTDVASIQAALKQSQETVSLQLSKEAEIALAQIMRKKIDGQILIVCPNERQAELMLEYAATQPSAILHGKTRGLERRAIIDAWRNGKIKMLFGTRQSVLLPAKKLELVIVTDSGSEDYGMLDRNPRIDSRTATYLLAKQYNARLIFTGSFPRLEELHESTIASFTDFIKPSVVILGAQEEATGIPFLTETLAKKIETNKRRTLILYNKKGIAQRLQCSKCGHIPLCGTCSAIPQIRLSDLVCGVCKTEMWIPKKCPSCGFETLRQKGIGNQSLARSFAKRFPGKTVAIVDKEHPSNHTADILIVTEFYFANFWVPFLRPEFGVIADVAFDLSFTGDDFRSAEKSAYRLYRLLSFSQQQRSECVIQTWLPEMVRGMLKPEDWLKNELNTRKTYKLPPYEPRYGILDKNGKTAYKSTPDDFTKQPDSTIINVDATRYDSLPGSQKSE